MDERDLNDLENAENWDFDRATVHPPSKTARAVVPVSFEASDLACVSASARKQGKMLSEFIREAVLDKINSDQSMLNVKTSETNRPDPLG